MIEMQFERLANGTVNDGYAYLLFKSSGLPFHDYHLHDDDPAAADTSAPTSLGTVRHVWV